MINLVRQDRLLRPTEGAAGQATEAYFTQDELPVGFHAGTQDFGVSRRTAGNQLGFHTGSHWRSIAANHTWNSLWWNSGVVFDRGSIAHYSPGRLGKISATGESRWVAKTFSFGIAKRLHQICYRKTAPVKTISKILMGSAHFSSSIFKTPQTWRPAGCGEGGLEAPAVDRGAWGNWNQLRDFFDTIINWVQHENQLGFHAGESKSGKPTGKPATA